MIVNKSLLKLFLRLSYIVGHNSNYGMQHKILHLSEYSTMIFRLLWHYVMLLALAVDVSGLNWIGFIHING